MMLVMLSWTHSAHAASNNSNYVWRLMNAWWAHLKSYRGACCLWWEDTRCHEYSRVRSADKMMRRNWENLIKGFRWVPTWKHHQTESTSPLWLGEMTSWEKSERREIRVFCKWAPNTPKHYLRFSITPWKLTLCGMYVKVLKRYVQLNFTFPGVHRVWKVVSRQYWKWNLKTNCAFWKFIHNQIGTKHKQLVSCSVYLILLDILVTLLFWLLPL